MKSKLLFWFVSFLFENQKYIKVLWLIFSPDRNGNPVIANSELDYEISLRSVRFARLSSFLAMTD